MKRVLLSIIGSGLWMCSMAIPAKPGLVAYTQPDGSVINIRLVGDEHGHVIYSESGLLLVEADGRLEYARFDSSGVPVASGMMASASGEANARSLNLQSEVNIQGWAERMTAVRNDRLKLQADAKARRLSTRSDDAETAEPEYGVVPKNFARCETTFPVLGEQKGLVIVVEYDDVPLEYGDHNYFYRMLNQEGFSDFGSLGSARDWFIENSNGRFIPEFDVYGPVKLPNNRKYYGGNDSYGNDQRAYEMAIDACRMLDDDVDFSMYDRDGDGVIDNVFIFYAGKGEHDSGIKNAVWPHSWDIAIAMPDEEFVFDGVRLNHYACTCEFPSGYRRPDGIGTFIHEFSHVIGLPDLYVTNYSSGFTPGEWSVMDQGPYNNDRLTPPNYSSYEKCALGWIEMKPFSDGVIELNDLFSSNEAYVLPTDNENEFFFFENRQQKGNDAFLPGHGMVVWHVDYKPAVWALNAVNNTSSHQCVDLVEADNLKSTGTRAGDAFPGTKNVTSFGFETRPQLVSWSKERLAYDLEEITESEDGVISFRAVPYGSNVVDLIGASTEDGDGIFYDLMGRRVENPSKGIYIRNGKKVLIND